MIFTFCEMMLLQACIIFGYFSAVNTQSTQPSLNQFCFGDVCYIRPVLSSGRNWQDAQDRCKEFSSTLPIVDRPERQRSFEAAVRYFTTGDERNTGIWIGAKAFYSQPENWTWLDESIYSEKEVIQGQGAYDKSYAFVSNSSGKVLAYPSNPTDSHSYLCCYPTPAAACKNDTTQMAFYIENRCYVMYNEGLSWFSARNVCLLKSGDLASFTNISLLDGKIDSKDYWVGLRNSRWSWQNAVSDMPKDVTYTLWKSGQPNDAGPTCLNTDERESLYWRDRSCTEFSHFICQVINTTVMTPEQTPNITMTRPTPVRTPGNTNSLLSSTSSSDISTYGSVNIPLAVGLGVGIGVPVVISIVIVIIVIIVRRKQRNSTAGGNSRSTNKFASKNSPNNPETETSEMNEMENGGTRSDNSSSAQYATIRGAMGLDQAANLVLPSNHGTVYAPLSFNQASC